MRKGERMKFRPLHDRVLVRRVEAEEKTAGGIIIPDTAKEKPQEGEVVAVGGGAKSEDGTVTPLDVKAGDRILFGKWSGTEVKIDGEDLLIMKESDILGHRGLTPFPAPAGTWISVSTGPRPHSGNKGRKLEHGSQRRTLCT
jgi:chaperonin GroES